MAKLGKPLPVAKEIAPPSKEEEDKFIARWNANCPAWAVGLLEAQSINDENPTAKFLYDKARMVYIRRKDGREFTLRDIRAAYLEYSRKISTR